RRLARMPCPRAHLSGRTRYGRRPSSPRLRSPTAARRSPLPLMGLADLGLSDPPQPRCALSVLIPFYNEAGNIAPLLDEVHAALEGVDYEVVCVDDRASDATAAELAAASAASNRVVVLTHVKRRGKSAALFTGLRSARGDWVQLLDGDGQNDPAD